MKKPKMSAVRRRRLYCEARAIIAVAMLSKDAPRYRTIAQRLNLSEVAAELADEIWNDANGPDDWSPLTEEHALERVQDYIDMEDLV